MSAASWNSRAIEQPAAKVGGWHKGRRLAIASLRKRGLADGETSAIARNHNSFKQQASTSRRSLGEQAASSVSRRAAESHVAVEVSIPGPCAPPAGSGAGVAGGAEKGATFTPCGQRPSLEGSNAGLTAATRDWDRASSPLGLFRWRAARGRGVVLVQSFGHSQTLPDCSRAGHSVGGNTPTREVRFVARLRVFCGEFTLQVCWRMRRAGGGLCPNELGPAPAPHAAVPLPPRWESAPIQGGVGLASFERATCTRMCSRPLIEAAGAFQMAPMSSGDRPPA